MQPIILVLLFLLGCLVLVATYQIESPVAWTILCFVVGIAAWVLFNVVE